MSFRLRSLGCQSLRVWFPLNFQLTAVFMFLSVGSGQCQNYFTFGKTEHIELKTSSVYTAVKLTSEQSKRLQNRKFELFNHGVSKENPTELPRQILLYRKEAYVRFKALLLGDQ